MKKSKGLLVSMVLIGIIIGSLLGIGCSQEKENDLLPFEEVVREYFSSEGVINVKENMDYMESYLETYEWKEGESFVEIPPSDSMETLYESYRVLFTEEAYDRYFGKTSEFLEYKELMFWGEAVSEVKSCELKEEENGITFSCDIQCSYGDTIKNYSVGGSLWLNENRKIQDIQVTSGLDMREDISCYIRENNISPFD